MSAILAENPAITFSSKKELHFFDRAKSSAMFRKEHLGPDVETPKRFLTELKEDIVDPLIPYFDKKKMSDKSFFNVNPEKLTPYDRNWPIDTNEPLVPEKAGKKRKKVKFLTEGIRSEVSIECAMMFPWSESPW